MSKNNRKGRPEKIGDTPGEQFRLDVDRAIRKRRADDKATGTKRRHRQPVDIIGPDGKSIIPRRSDSGKKGKQAANKDKGKGGGWPANKGKGRGADRPEAYHYVRQPLDTWQDVAALEVKQAMTKRGRGHPTAAETAMRPMQRERMLAALRQGASPSAAAAYAGISRATYYRWRDADEAFAAAIIDATEAGTDRLEDELLARATDPNNPSPIALIVALKARRPEKYKEGYVAPNSGNAGVTLNVALTFESKLEGLANAIRERHAIAAQKQIEAEAIPTRDRTAVDVEGAPVLERVE